MKLRLTLALFLVMTFSSPSCSSKTSKVLDVKHDKKPSFKVVGYLHEGNFSQIDQIELFRLTHLDIAFANPDELGHLVFEEEKGLPVVVQKAHQAKVKVFISLAGGGIDEKLASYWLRVLQPAYRPTFIREIVSFCKKNQLDGVDVDIEWNLIPTITDLYTPFVLELKTALQTENMGISSALNVKGLHPSITQESLEAYDFINVMVYDKTGIWRPDIPGPHAPYDYAEEALKYWTIERKIPAHKLTLGVPFYGHDFEAVRYISYRSILAKNVTLAYQDSVNRTYYNGIPSMVAKTELAKKSFGGVMIWELAQDAYDDLSLLRAIDQTIKAGHQPVTTYYANTDGDGYGDPQKPTQAVKAPRHYVQNRLDCEDTNPQIYPGSKFKDCH